VRARPGDDLPRLELAAADDPAGTLQLIVAGAVLTHWALMELVALALRGLVFGG
jgi:hypothetical protein